MSDEMIDLDVGPTGAVGRPPRRGARWFWAVGVTVLLAAAVVAVTVIGPDHTPHPPPPPTGGPLAWMDKLVNAPTRGGLAGDQAFTADLVAQITQLVRSGSTYDVLRAVDGRVHPEQDVRLIFAADAGDLRIAVLALSLRTQPDPNSGRGHTTVLWLSGPRGATGIQLVSSITTRPGPDFMSGNAFPEPFTIVTIGDPAAPLAWVGLAPPQCTIASADDAPDATDFRDEPTGSYVVRTQAAARAEYLRVTCDGVVRSEAPAPNGTPVLHDDAIAALTRAAGLPELADSVAVRRSFGFFARLAGGQLTGQPRLLWAGRVPNPAALGASAGFGLTVLAAPALRVGWLVQVAIWEDFGNPGMNVETLADVATGPGDLVAVPVHYIGPVRVAVIAPPGVSAIQVLAEDGSSFSGTPVVNRLAVLPAGTPAVPRLRAVEAAGGAEPAVPVAMDSGNDTVYNWD
jgi:hypothetical protein